MEERLLEYMTVLRDFGRIYTQKILGGDRDSALSLKLSRIKALYAFKGKSACTMTELAENIGAKLPSMTMMIDNLAEEGYVERARDEQDRRKVIVKLTAKGEDARSSFLDQRRRISKALFARLKDSEKSELMTSMGRVCSILEKAFVEDMD